jgi:hypothetical protein
MQMQMVGGDDGGIGMGMALDDMVHQLAGDQGFAHLLQDESLVGLIGAVEDQEKGGHK